MRRGPVSSLAFRFCLAFVFFVSFVASGLFLTPIVAQQRPDRSRPPALGPAPALDLPPVQTRTLSNGLRVWLVEAREVPLVQVNLVILSGAADDPAGRFGVASLTAAMLDEGAGSRDALEIADAIDLLGATLSTTASFDASAVRLNVPAARLTDALPVMADVVRRPTFPQSELDRIRQERLTSLMQARDDAASVAPIAFSRAVFGSDHRFGTAAIGTEATLKAFTPADLRAFHAAMYQPSNATLVAVGDFETEVMAQALETHFGDWKNGAGVTRTPVPAAQPLAAREVWIVDLPGAAQSQVRVGGVGVARSTPDYFTLQVLNTILGGSFTSRLNQNLRETHGYSYGASSRFDMRRSPGPFTAGAGVQTDKTSEALREIFNELQAIAAPVGADELTKARNYIALGLPGEFETIGDLASRLEELIVYGLPDDYFDGYVANVQAVTSEAVGAAAAAHMHPQRFAVVVVGDRSVIEAGIRALGLGPVRILSVDEVFVR